MNSFTGHNKYVGQAPFITPDCKKTSSKKKNNYPVSSKSKNKSDSSDNSKKEAIAIKYPKRITDILMNWMIHNKEDPFPDQNAITDLMQLTGLDQSQIVNWTTNVRKRNMKATCEGLKKPHHFIDFLFLAQARDNQRRKTQQNHSDNLSMHNAQQMERNVITPPFKQNNNGRFTSSWTPSSECVPMPSYTRGHYYHEATNYPSYSSNSARIFDASKKFNFADKQVVMEPLHADEPSKPDELVGFSNTWSSTCHHQPDTYRSNEEIHLDDSSSIGSGFSCYSGVQNNACDEINTGTAETGSFWESKTDFQQHFHPLVQVPLAEEHQEIARTDKHSYPLIQGKKEVKQIKIYEDIVLSDDDLSMDTDFLQNGKESQTDDEDINDEEWAKVDLDIDIKY